MTWVIGSLGRALDVLGPDRRWRWLVLVVLAVMVAALEAAGALLMYAFVAFVISPGGETAVPIVGPLTARLSDLTATDPRVLTASMVAVFFVIRTPIMVSQQYVRSRIVENAAATLSADLLRVYLDMPYLFHAERNSAELIRNAYVSTQQFASSVLNPLVVINAESIVALGLTAMLIVVAPPTLLIAMAVMGLLVLGMLRLMQPRLTTLGRQAQASRKGGLKSMQQALGGFRDIRLLGQEEAFAFAYERQRFAVASAEYRRTTLAEVPRALVETMLVLIIVGTYVLTVRAGDGVDQMIATLAAFAYAALRLQPSIQRMVQAATELRFGSALLDDLQRDARLGRQAPDRRASRAGDTATTERTFTGSIELRDVSFSYGEGEEALRAVDLTISRGEFIGICGPTGGGKSTLVDLVAGLLEPTTGSVLIDREPIGDDVSWWHARIGVVSQTVFLIDDTLAANIALGEDPQRIDQARLARCVDRAQLSDVISELPAGLDTVVGERGVRLSGGQRQRVAIARALYREPEVIILDEGTSALDSATERAIVRAVDELREGRTLIAVAHRISTIRHADRIVVVSAGMVVASGTATELMATSELFRTLVGDPSDVRADGADRTSE